MRGIGSRANVKQPSSYAKATEDKQGKKKMKKLMIVAAVALATVCANAATVSWTITGVAENSTALTQGHTYMFFADSATAAATQMAALVDLAGSGVAAFTTAMGASAWNDTKKATAAGTFSIGTTATMGGYTLPTNESLGLSGNTKYYAYAVIFDTETITDASHYIVAQGTATTSGFSTKDSSTSQSATAVLGAQGSRTWYEVSNIPEPTTGLLVLLGVAGLALRRRRA